MIPVNPPPELIDFDKKVRQPGNAWLLKNPDLKKGTKDYWSPFKSYLADGFNNLCGYNVKSFFKEFKDYRIQDISDDKIQEWLVFHKLDVYSLLREYSEQCYQKR